MTEIVMERRLKGQLADIWALLTQPREMERWWGPDGYRIRVDHLDLVVGGRLDYVMIADTPQMADFMKANGMPAEIPTSLTYTEIVPMTRLGFSHVVNFVPGHPPYEVHDLIELAQMGDSVHLTARVGRMHDDLWTDRSRMGWEQQLNKLLVMYPGA